MYSIFAFIKANIKIKPIMTHANEKRALFEKLKMFPGSIGEVSKRSGKTRQSIRDILSNDLWDNDDVVAIARQVIDERKEHLQEFLQTA
jgi:hypothetical protein